VTDNTNQQLVLVDFDRTLFDLQLFYGTVWATLGEMYGFDAEKAIAEMRDYYYEAHNGYHGTYGFANHLHHYAPDADEHETIAVLKDKLAGKRMLYDDADVIFEWAKTREVRILSFGETHLQEFKMAFCQELAVIPQDFILSPKPQFIADTYPGRHGVLVDDKIEKGLPEGFKQIWIVRDPNDPRLENKPDGDIILVNSLKRVTEFL
jgi:hypothetical protein